MISTNLKDTHKITIWTGIIIIIVLLIRNFVVDTCSCSILETRPITGNENSLFLTHQKPNKKASSYTIQRYIQELMQLAVKVTFY